ncbi:MAG: T9SS type A sorting domain-containing protein [Bacteroidetes bacterium]|nr:MAG: T9SS type A sorting domain-containing protein [Bacteroidota bacterium]
MRYPVVFKTTSYICLFLLGAAVAGNAQIFWFESFDNEATSIGNWTYGGTNNGFTSWSWTDDPAAGYQDPDLPVFAAPTANTGYFYFDSDNNGQVPHDVWLTGSGHPADCSGKQDVRLRFYTQYIYFNPAGTVAQIGVSTDGVDFTYKPLFEGLQANLPYHDWVEVDLDEADGQPQVWLRFRWIGNYEYHWKVDDLVLFESCAADPATIICDDFNTYVPAQKLGVQADHWTTWSGLEGGDEDGVVTTEQRYSPPYALKVTGTDPAGGPENVILDLGNRSGGRYALDWQMFVPAGRAAYYAFRDTVPAGAGSGTVYVYFNEDQTGEIRQVKSGPALATFAFPAGQWFQMEQVVDLDHNLIDISLNGTRVFRRGYSHALGGINFTGLNGTYQYYIDDVRFADLPAAFFNPDSCATAYELTPYFGQMPDEPQVTGIFDNTGATASDTDPEISCWNEVGSGGLDLLNTTMWFTFTGDGNTYEVETVPCNATNYIGTAQNDPGDTQMAIFAGSDCSDLSLVACNDDLFPSGVPDWRAGITLETQPGQSYFLLIDGFENQGVVATGEFCISVTQQIVIACNEGQVGPFSVANEGLLCQGESLQDLLSIDVDSFVLPTVGPVSGLAWCFSVLPLDTGSWPAPGEIYASTPFTADVSLPVLLNNGATLDYGEYYLTPVVVGGGVLLNPNAGPYIYNVEVPPPDGCYSIGTSRRVVLLPTLSALSVSAQVTEESVPPGNNGMISLTASGGAGEYLDDPTLYQYAWNTGEDTTALNNLGAANYTVTISDASGCVGPQVLEVTVGQIVKTAQPEIVEEMHLFPNPVRDRLQVELRLKAPVDVRMELLDLTGQVLLKKRIDPSVHIKQELDLHGWAAGTYILQIILDEGGWCWPVVVHP